MASPVVEELVNAAGRALTIKSAADRLLNTATPLLRRAMEQRASAAEAKARAASPATRAPVSSPEVETIDPVVPQQGMVEESSQSLRSGPMVPQPQLQQQQRIFGGPTALSRRGNEGDTQAQGIMDDIDAIEEPNNQARMNDDAVGYRSYNQYGRAAADYDERNVFIAPSDRLPRFEIDDTPSRINPRYLQSIRTSAPAREISGGGIQVLPLGDKNLTNLKLGDIFDHPELYRYYPEARNIKIGRIPSTDKSNKIASFSNKENKLKLRTFSTDEESLRSTIIHELQHFVQKEEGFARGGSPDEFLRPHLKGFDSFQERVKLADRKVEIYQNRLNLDPNDTNVQALFARAKAERDMLDDTLNEAYDDYYRLTGEKEARDAQNRLTMSPIEKALNLPALADREAMEDAITLAQDQAISGNIVPGMSYEAGHIVFHGGPVSAIEKFMLKFIGTGEGAVHRGWGFYFADRPSISSGYRKQRAQDKLELDGLDQEGRFELSQVWRKMQIKNDIRRHFGVGDAATKTSVKSGWDLKDELEFNTKLLFIDLQRTWQKSEITREMLDSTAEAVWNRSFTHRINSLFNESTAALQDARSINPEAGSGGPLFTEEATARWMEIEDHIKNIRALREDPTAKASFVRELADAFAEDMARTREVKLSEDAGLFVLDIKANPDLDYVHLDKPFKDQSKKIKAAFNDIFGGFSNLTFMNPSDKSEYLVKHLERSFKSIGDLVNDPTIPIKEQKSRIGSVIGLNPAHLERFKKVYRLTLDTTSEEFSRARIDRKFASLVMKEFGIPGSAHWDSFSRNSALPERKRTNNFVIWDEDIIEQLAVQPHSWRDRGKLEVDPTDHPLTDEYTPSQ